MRRYLAPLALILLNLGCASHSAEFAKMRDFYASGQYDLADQVLEESGIREQERNRLLYRLEKASILDKKGERQESRKLFKDADQLISKLFTVSVSKEALTYLYNDTAQDYSGEDYEKVGLHAVMALSFLQDQDLGAARVEARKINTRLDEINQKYDGDAKNQYTEDAFASYLSGAIFEANGEWDSAIIDYRKALKSYESSYASKFGVSAPSQLVNALARLYRKRDRRDDLKQLQLAHARADGNDLANGSGEVLVLYEKDIVSPKVAKEFIFPISGKIVRLSFPTLVPKSHAATQTLTLSAGGSKQSELLENYDKIAFQTLEDKRGRIILKQGARILAKAQIAEQARQNLGELAGLAANIATMATEVADTRSWMLMPSAIYGARWTLPAGQHELSFSRGGMRYGLRKFAVKAGGLTILRLTQEADEQDLALLTGPPAALSKID